jgi:hypothetical protein
LCDELEVEYFCWRLVLEKVATVTEISTTISFSDAIKLNALLDMQADMRAAMQEQAKK